MLELATEPFAGPCAQSAAARCCVSVATVSEIGEGWCERAPVGSGDSLRPAVVSALMQAWSALLLPECVATPAVLVWVDLTAGKSGSEQRFGWAGR